MLVSIVVPLFNEEKALPLFHKQLLDTLQAAPNEFEVWYVAGGSTDNTSALVREFHRQDHRVKLLELSRNYGHQAALTAGLDYAQGDVVISMDGDGQHPPSLLSVMLDAYEQGNDVVLTQRRMTQDISWSTQTFSRLFYALINRFSASEIVPDSADFRLLSREVVDELRNMREQHRFLRGMISWMGYQQKIIQFDAPPRVAGHTKYTLRKRLKLATDAIFSFSTTPVTLAIVAGFFVLGLALLEVLYIIVITLLGRQGDIPPGWVSLMFAVLGLGGVQLIAIGIIGQYVGVTFQESKRRPVYFVNKRLSTLEPAPSISAENSPSIKELN